MRGPQIDNALNLGLAKMTWEICEVQSCLETKWLFMAYPSVKGPQVVRYCWRRDT